jgi:hypothetical protein
MGRVSLNLKVPSRFITVESQFILVIATAYESQNRSYDCNPLTFHSFISRLSLPTYFRKPLITIAKAWMVSDVSLDILIVLFLSLALYRHRTGFRRWVRYLSLSFGRLAVLTLLLGSTDAIINRLAWYALHTGLITRHHAFLLLESHSSTHKGRWNSSVCLANLIVVLIDELQWLPRPCPR